MGQQQLLLLVLGIVVVGIAIVIGIATYSENTVKTSYDAMVQESLDIALDMQVWQQKPELFGDSPDANKIGASTAFNGMSFVSLGYDPDALSNPACYHTLNATYRLFRFGGAIVILVGTNVSHQNQVVTIIRGARQADVTVCALDNGPINNICARGNIDIADGSDFGGVTAACP